ncbi:response regulator receiver [Nitrosococcus halophilus Nc 4]|uniref:Response regulator receiver n=1 Tax=Nitrosococcus halophilus (strain Nc4) TaxID=472759 RepID=D5C1Q6_NITHN|nr:response regulator [Nitrosococcus halophilus]ADE14689.1 response regulator receiver [Nitrosococcus halophilus Nc 4]
MENQAVIYIVDDDDSVLRSLRRLIKSAGFVVETFTSAESFLQTGHPREKGCLILDIQLPGINGLDLQEKLASAHCKLPIIFITARTDTASQVRALAAGAVAFLFKPVDDQVLLDGINAALNPSTPIKLENGLGKE